jgi:gliding motility-associated-like protein
MELKLKLPFYHRLIFKIFFTTLFVFTGMQVFAQLPVPAFRATPISGCAPVLVDFTDESTGATSWQWDLGNGVTSTQQNPSTLYTNPGTYTVTLTVTNASGSQSLTKTNFITINDPPTPDFNSNITSGCFPLRAQFTDLSNPGTGTIVSWSWNFGNGATSTLQNPLYIYTVSGTFYVSLTVTNSAGCSKTIVKPAYISVSTGVTVDFTVSPPTKCKAPEIINFSNLSNGPGTLSYIWDFGDGNTSTLQNPSHNFLTAGPFNVQLITTSSSGCIDTLLRTNAVQLNNVQTVIGSPANACINEPINFQNLSSTTPLSSTWFFGDATTSNQISPTKAYTTTGSFVIRLINQYSQCIDSTTASISINPRPTAAFTSTDSISCRAPHTVNFQNQSTGSVSWNWSFGDGGSSTLQNPSHTYTALGSYTVQLIAINSFGCTDTVVKTNFVRIEKPVFNPVIFPFEGCELLTVNFSANTTAVDSIAQWFWDFGNGNTSTIKNTSSVFDSGSYTIKLRVVTVQGCIDSVVITNGVRVGTPPTANFSASPMNVCAFAPTQFTDLSTGNPDEWFWDFGDGTTSNLQNPSHIYQTTGPFTVTLTAFNNRCRNTITRTSYITVLPPISRFNYAVSCLVNKRQVQFTDASIGPVTWLWNFGDGITSTLQNPVHIYGTLSNYTVTLTTTNGSCSHTISTVINLVDAVPDFTADRVMACKQTQTITFSSTSTNAASIVSYLWNFGDGNTSTLQSPQHIYINSGNYTVTLTITDINGCVNTNTKNNFIRINGPTAGFTVPATQYCVNNSVIFTNTSTTDGVNAITNVEWQMGNGLTLNSLTNPFVYMYTVEGGYLVRQTVTDASGCSSVFIVSPINVFDPRADFTVDTPSCPGALIIFNNQSYGGSSGKTYNWNFGDGNTSTAINPTHSYAVTGNYTVTLTVTEPIGCTNSLPKVIRIERPRASFTVNDSISICQPFDAKFTSTSTFTTNLSWLFGDGNTASGFNSSNFYITPGSYTVRLVATSPGGCTDTAYKLMRLGRDTGSLNYAPLIGCAPLAVTLQTRTDVPLSYTWDLGDGNIITTTDSNRTHSYDAGFYSPKVIIRDRLGCFGIIEGIDTIKALGSRPNFGVDNYLFCDSGTVQFSDSTISTDLITGYLWNFGDGNFSSSITPFHKYTSPGLYTVSLTINTQAGCVNTKTKNAIVKVVPSPQISIIGAASFCVPVNFQLQGNWLNPDTSILKWQWNIDGQIFNTQNPPAINRTVADSVFIQLTAISGSGCKDTANHLAVVHPLPSVRAGNDTTICLGDFATLNPTGANSYVWSPSTYLNCTNCTNPFATITNPIQYTVTGTSPFGCVNKDSVLVKVKKPFTVRVSAGDTLCVGESITLSAFGAENYIWTPPTGLNNTAISNPTATPQTTTNYKVVGYDSLNCFQDSAFIPVVVYNYPVVILKDTTIRAGDTILLNPQLSADVNNILWSPSNNLSCTNCFTPFAWPLQTTTYRITASNDGDCITRKNVKINVLCSKEDVFIPNAFTPNNDNINDRFYIIGKAVKTVIYLRVYNRWGNLVFEKSYFDANNRSLGWDGKINGVDAPVGLYNYSTQVICGNGGIIPLGGSISLIR